MTARTLRRTTRTMVAASMISALVTVPAIALAAGPPRTSGPDIIDRLVKQKFGDRGFPSWSRTATEARDALASQSLPPAAEGARATTADAGADPAGTAPDQSQPQQPESAQVTAKAARRDRIDDAVFWEDGHAGGRDMALALTAAGIPYGTNVGRNDLVRAGHQLGVKFGPRIDSGEIERVARRAWRYGGRRMAASGLDFQGRLDAHDIAQRAAELGIPIGSQVDAGDIVAVIAAGQQGLADLLDAGGFPYGKVVNTSDLRTAARLHGVRLGKQGQLAPAEARKVARTVADKGDPRRTLLFAKIGNVEFYLPGRRPAYVGLHQASNPQVLPMRRRGLPLTEFLPSRGRGTNRAGAADIPLPPGDRVYAPVSGRVVEAKRYALYGRYTDEMLRIVPDDDTRMLTTVLHVKQLRVSEGDRVVAGETVIADSARKLPFWSQVDGYSGRPWGHPHIETRWR